MELVDFLRARLDEDEAAARAVGYDRIEAVDYLWGTRHLLLQRNDGGESKATTELDADLAAHIVRHDPARVLAEVEAKRRLLLWAESAEGGLFLFPVVDTLVEAYRNHPDFDPAWLES